MDISRIAPPQPYAALIFDCDGTLADTMPKHYHAWTEALKLFGAEFPETRFYQLGGVPTAEIVRTLNREFGYTLDVGQTHAEKERIYTTMVDSVREIEAVASIARAHFGRVPMAVASGGERYIVEATLAAIGLQSLFDFVISADDVTHGKPAPDMFLLAAQKMGVAPEDCVVYEDGDPGLQAAASAGMRVVDVRVLWQD